MSVRAWADDLEATMFSVEEAGVAWITLNRPEAANARNQRMRDELMRLYAGVASDPDINVVVLTGAGDRFFCAGMDMKEAGGPESQAQRRARLRASRDIEVLAALPQPTVAAINGAAMGGGFEMALACDIRVIADTARVGLPELKLGLVPGGGATQRLPRVVGMAKTFELLYLAPTLVGPEVVSAGLATVSVTAADLEATVRSLTGEIAAKPRAALCAAKELVRKGHDLPLAAGIEMELDALLFLMQARLDATATDSEPVTAPTPATPATAQETPS